MRRINVRHELIEQNRLRVTLENRFEKKLLSAFRAIGIECGKAIEARQPLDAIYQGIAGKLAPVFQQQYNDVINLFAARTSQQLKPEKAEQRFEYLAREWYRYSGAQRVQEVSGTTKSIIQKTLLDGFSEELTQTQIAKNVRERTGGVIGARRAQTIARTETHAAANFASNRIAEEVGANSMIKRWVSADDDRTRPHHREMNGKEVTINDYFIVPYKGIPYKMSYPGDPAGGAGNVINCRCVIAYALPEDQITDPKQEQEAAWGDASPEEVIFHNNSWGTDPTIREAISVTKAVPNIKYEEARAYCSSTEIAMSPKKGAALTEEDRTIWRHEYGHWVDNNNRVKGQNPNLGYMSSEAWSEIKADRKAISDDQTIDRRRRFTSEYIKLTNDEVSVKQFEKELEKTWLTASDIYKLIGQEGKERIGKDQALTSSLIAGIKTKFLGGGDNGRSGLTGWLHSATQKGSSEGLMFADFIEAVTDTEHGFGHGKRYYEKFPNAGGLRSGVRVGHTTEAYANYTALIGGKNGSTWRKVLEEFAPKTVAKFDALTAEITKGKPTP